MSDTIIIESNRQISLKQQNETLSNAEDNVLVDSGFNNSSWKTIIQSGIEVNVGDQISVEATMINTKGTPDDTIEFLGDQNSLQSDDLVDNESDLEFYFYIVNNQDFNINLPFSGCQVRSSQADAITQKYGLLDFSTFAKFVANYPYKAIEGFTYNPTTAKFTGPNTDAPIQNAPSATMNPNPIKMYYITGFNPNTNGSYSNPSLYTRTANIKVDIGFNTPSSVANKITSQLQERNGDARAFLYGEVPPAQFPPEFPLKEYSVPAITTNTYRTIATATGACAYARNQGQWNSLFENEDAQHAEGTNYEEAQGAKLFYDNLLCGNPFEYVARGVCWNRFKQFCEEPANVNVNNYEQHSMVKINEFEICSIDNLDSEPHGQPVVVATSRTLTTNLQNPPVLLLNPSSCITTNLLYHQEPLNDIKQLLDASKYIPDNLVSQPRQIDKIALKRAYEVDFPFATGDMNASLGATDHKINLMNAGGRANNIDPATDSYIIQQPVANPPLISLAVPAFNAPRGGNQLQSMMTNGIKASHCHIMAEYIDDIYDAPPDQNEQYALKLPTNSLFTFYDSNNQRGNISLSKSLNVAVVPVFYKEANLPNPSLKDVPFCAFVSLWNFAERNCLFPIKDESLGMFSINCVDNILAKPQSIQKKGDASQKNEFPTGSENRRYMDFMYIGSDSPQLKFDSQGDGRFSLTEFHTPYRAGNGTFQIIPKTRNAQSGQISAVANRQQFSFSIVDNQNSAQASNTISQGLNPAPWITSIGGIALKGIQVPSKKNLATLTNINAILPDVFKNTLLSKLGFSAEQLLPFIGQVQGLFNRDIYNKFLGNQQPMLQKEITMVRPFTTNGYLSAFASIAGTTNNDHMPMENFGTMNFDDPTMETNIDCESDELIAKNLPTKLDFAYLVVYSDIVNSSLFYGGGNGGSKIPAMGYISRNYSQGDYFYSFSTTWNYTADKDYILTEINTKITLPNGEPAPIEPNSSVIYKITKPKSLPPPPQSPPAHHHKGYKDRSTKEHKK